MKHHWRFVKGTAYGPYYWHCDSCPCINLLGYEDDPWHNNCVKMTTKEKDAKQFLEVLK